MKISIFRTAALENRIIGLDCLRILCMVMVIILHILGQGGVLNEVSQEAQTIMWPGLWSVFAFVRWIAMRFYQDI